MANVIKTVMTYPLNGSTRDFNIPFEYLARKFVQVTLLGVDRKVLTLNTDYRFSTKTTITTTQAWGAAQGYTQIEIRRYTSATERLVDFTDGSILRAYDLNVSQIQTMHVAEEARDLTADTIGVNNEGHLDARGRRIVNLGNAVNDRDAVPFGQLKAMNQNAYDSMNKALQYRNESETLKNQTQGFRNEAEQFRNQASVSQQNAAASQAAAKTSETNAQVSAQNAAGSNASALTAANNAKTSETNAKTSEVNAKASEDRAKLYADDVHANVASYGANPVGSVVMSPTGKGMPGYLPLDGSKFDEKVYPELYSYLGTNILPDWRNRYIKMADTIDKVGTKGAWGLKAISGAVAVAAGMHTHAITVAAGGNHTHSASTGEAGDHTHGLDVGVGGEAGNVYRINQARHAVSTANDRVKAAGKHTHTVSVAAAGNHTHTATAAQDGSHTHGVSIPAQGSGQNEMDHVKAWFWIKAFGTTNSEQMAQVSKELENIRTAVNTANDAKTAVGGFQGRLDTLSDKVGVLESPAAYERILVHEAYNITYGTSKNTVIEGCNHTTIMDALIKAGRIPSGTTIATVMLTIEFYNTPIGLYSVRASAPVQLYTAITNDARWYLTRASIGGHAANCEGIDMGTVLRSQAGSGLAGIGFNIVGSTKPNTQAVGNIKVYASVIHW